MGRRKGVPGTDKQGLKRLKMSVKTKEEYLISSQQMAKFNIILGQMGRGKDKEFKADLVRQFTGARCTSSKDMTWKEAKDMLAALEKTGAGNSAGSERGAGSESGKQSEGDRKRKLLIHYAYQMNWVVESGGQTKVDMERIDRWCVKYGQYHKALMEHSSFELSAILVQFEKAFKDYLKAVTK